METYEHNACKEAWEPSTNMIKEPMIAFIIKMFLSLKHSTDEFTLYLKVIHLTF